jgi:uncharacterized alkaline shock family protein YloU
MTETEAGRNTGAHGLPSRAGGRAAHAAQEPGRRVNGIATALADPGALDSTTIIPRIPADADPATLPEPVTSAGAPAGPAPQPRRHRPAPSDAAPAPAPADKAAEKVVDKAAGKVGERAGSDASRPARLRGTTALGEDVVEKVVGFAAEQVDGVFDLGGDVARALTTIRERIGIGEGTSRRGVHVELSGRQARVTLTLVVQFGHPAIQVAEQVRENVIAAVEMMLTMDVTECNVIIDDIHVGD